MSRRDFKNLGISGDITFEKLKARTVNFDERVYVVKTRSLSILKVMVFLFAIVIVLRLFYLTVISGEKNRVLAESNRVHLVSIEAPRGKILDRDGRVLAYSQVEYFLRKADQVTLISESQVKELEKQGLASRDFEGELGKIDTKVTRKYPFGLKLAHIIGYTDQDSVGRVGIESSYDDFLRGKNGRELVEVDAIGRKVSILGREEPKIGADLTISIDSSLQDFAFEALKKHAEKAKSFRGALVIENPNSGEILALASYPSFDPENIGASVTDQNKPFFNRAIQGLYPPGSVYKLVNALAGLESGKVTRDTEVEDVGEFYLGDIKFSNWFYTQYGQKDGVLKLDRAIARSNDIYFYRLAQTTGLDTLRKMAIKIGFGQKTGIDLPGEEFGLVPDELWKKSTIGQPWYPGDTMHLGIGQGFMLVTPLQIAQMTSYMASNKLTRPYLVQKISSLSGESKVEPKVLGDKLASDVNLDYVRSGMKMACAKGGTGWPFFEAKYVIGCKTGTAEVAEGNPNAWFTAYAPFDAPKIVLTVLIEDGGEGSSVAGPAAKDILDFWFKIR